MQVCETNGRQKEKEKAKVNNNAAYVKYRLFVAVFDRKQIKKIP